MNENIEIIHLNDSNIKDNIDGIVHSFNEYIYLHNAFYGKGYMDIDKLRDYFDYKKDLIYLEEYDE